MFRSVLFAALCAVISFSLVSDANAAPRKKQANDLVQLVDEVMQLDEVLEALDGGAASSQIRGTLVDPYEWFDGKTYYFCQVGNTYYNCRFYDCSGCSLPSN